MPRQRTVKPKKDTSKAAAEAHAIASMPAAEALSFLRDTRGVSTWTASDLAESLKIGVADAKHVIAVLELQGYVKRADNDEWMTTLSGEEVSGSKIPRYRRERIERALDELRTRIAGLNRDPNGRTRSSRLSHTEIS
jgi:DNA-binding MarR family transcriptional regulator